MAHPQFPHLCSPLTIGLITVKNRTVMPPIGTRLLEDESRAWFRRMAAQRQEEKAIENTAKALAAARSKGLLVVHVGVAFRKDHPEIGPGAPLFQGIKQANALLKGPWGAEFYPGVKPTEGEIVVIKRGADGQRCTRRVHN